MSVWLEDASKMSIEAVRSPYGIVLAGHGSRDESGIKEFLQLVEVIRKSSECPVYGGFLEFAKPSIAEAARTAVADGIKRIVVVPALLTAATHAKNDMPSELLTLKREFPDTEFHFGAALDLHPTLLSICRERIIEAESTSSKLGKRSDTCLVVVGRGTSDPDANSDISKLSRLLEEGMGFGTSFVCYSGTAKPLVRDGLMAAAQLGYSRIVVLPYFLFDGVLIKRIYEASEAIRSRFKQIEILDAGYIGPDVRMAEVFLERAEEGLHGRAHMNCSLCKYRVQMVGFEAQVGTPQKAHHTKPVQSDRGSPSRTPYIPHPIEAESFRIIEQLIDWSETPQPERSIIQRLVHTTGDLNVGKSMFFSGGAVQAGIRALLRTRTVVTDVTMVETGIKRELRSDLAIRTWCGVHDEETKVISEQFGITRSAAGIRRAFELFGNDLVLTIGDAPTAVFEALELIRTQSWRPQLVIGLPVGFVGTEKCKDDLRRCMHVPRITNSGTRGGSPWAAAVINALLIAAKNSLAEGA